MVLRIKEREEAIQLLAMDPQVFGKLLTLHQKGYRVDVEALRDRIPLRQDAGKGPQMGSHGYRGCGGGKVFSWMPLMVLGYKRIYRRRNQVRRPMRAPQDRGMPYLPGHALHPRGYLVAYPTSSPSLPICFWSKKDHRKSFFLFGLCLVFLFRRTQK